MKYKKLITMIFILVSISAFADECNDDFCEDNICISKGIISSFLAWVRSFF
ncbi:hypothetical protein GF327_08320 [Candidatus Woesearchaeota archaeon]|nr:hypothetical protein [Candidatus Woesearchaeota archaeon]